LDGQALAVVHNPEPGRAPLALECRFGAVPADAAVPAFTRLLEANAVLGAHSGVSFGVDEQSGDVFCTRHLAIQGASARALLDDLAAMARMAARWQETFFLSLPEVDHVVFDVDRPSPEQGLNLLAPGLRASFAELVADYHRSVGVELSCAIPEEGDV